MAAAAGGRRALYLQGRAGIRASFADEEDGRYKFPSAGHDALMRTR